MAIRMLIEDRKIYEVTCVVEDEISMFLDTGEQRHLKFNDRVLVLGQTLKRIGLEREFDRGRVHVKEYEVVPPEADKQKSFSTMMNKLFSGHILYVEDRGSLIVEKSPQDKVVKEVFTPEGAPTEEPKEESEVKEEATDKEEKAPEERVEEAVSTPKLTVLKNDEGDKEEEEKPESDDVVIDVDDSDSKEDGKEDNKEEKKGTKKKSSKKKSKSKKGRSRKKKKK